MVDLPEDIGPLGRLFAELMLNPRGKATRQEFIERLNEWRAADWSGLLDIAKELEAWAKTEIKRHNRTKDTNRLIEDWEKRTGIHPYEFQDHYLEGVRVLEAMGKRQNKSLLIRAVVDYLRPDLTLPRTAPLRERQAATEERRRIEKAARELLDRPHERLRPLFEYRQAKGEQN